jgi:hypothetical protein
MWLIALTIVWGQANASLQLFCIVETINVVAYEDEYPKL